MHIKKVKEFSKSYCELIVTDNSKDVICVLDSIPLTDEMIPANGMKIKMLNAFFVDECPKITVVDDVKKQNYKLFKVGVFGMSYGLRGKIVDTKKYILKVYDFYVSLEYIFSSEYIEPKKFIYKEGEWLELIVDRFDVII